MTFCKTGGGTHRGTLDEHVEDEGTRDEEQVRDKGNLEEQVSDEMTLGKQCDGGW